MTKTTIKEAYCRLCAVSSPPDRLAYITPDEKCSVEIRIQLSRINSDVEFEDDILPKSVCFLCLTALKNAFEFVTSVEEAQNTLKSKLISSHKNNEIEIDSKEVTLKTETVNKDTDTSDDECLKKTEENDDSTDDSDNDTSADEENKKLTLLKQEKKSASLVKESDKEWPAKTWGDFQWKCSICETMCPTIHELTAHSMRDHNSCNTYHCLDCNSQKMILDRFVKHVRTHRPHLRLSCFLCCNVFPNRFLAYRHKKSHLTSQFVCRGCLTSFRTAKELNEHKKTYYRSVQPPVRPFLIPKDSLDCQICKKTFKSQNALITHMATHTDRKRDHMCDVCGKSYYNIYYLKEHKKKHSGIKPFECEMCKKAFTTKRQLKVHVGMHETAKPFECDECGKCFRLEAHVRLHKTTHADIRPYACTLCPKTFRLKSILGTHMRKHTGDKPYSCQICSNTFTSWSGYEKHSKSQHNTTVAKKKITREGVCIVEPGTGKLIYPDTSKQEWKKKILAPDRRGRKKKNKATELKSVDSIKSEIDVVGQ